MAIFIFIFLIVGGSLAVFRLLAPEMYLRVRRPQFNFPWARAHLLDEDPPKTYPVLDRLPPAIDLPMQQDEMPSSLSDKLNKMDVLLLEKNKVMDRLQSELEAERSHRAEFDKVKSIMDEEIQHLKEQIKSLKKQKEQSNA